MNINKQIINNIFKHAIEKEWTKVTDIIISHNLENELDTNIRNKNGDTLLHFALSIGCDVPIIEKLLNYIDFFLQYNIVFFIY